MAKQKKTIKNKYSKGLVKSRKFPWLSRLELSVLGRGGHFDSEGLIRNENDCIRCTTMVTTTGERCKNFATVGETSCHIHGGQRARAKTGKVRMYSAFIQDPRLATVYERAQENEELVGIREELSLLRVLLAKAIGENPNLDLKDIKNVAGIVGEIRQLVKDCAQTEIRLGQLIDIGKVTIIVKNLANIIQKYITDEEILKKIAEEFDDVVWPAPLATTPQPERTKPVRKVSGLPGEVCAGSVGDKNSN